MTKANTTEGNIINKQFDCDVLVVGAGIGGLCFARDIASMGYSVTIVERSSQIGGVWATNNYPGLRLHSPGAAYRCLSVVPSWNLNHDVSENYRPTRDEVLEYCHHLAEHENINILFNTNCNHKDHTVLENGGVSVELAGRTHTARFLFASGTFSNHWTGTPKFPPGFEGHPQSIHSSQLTKQEIKDIQDGKGQVVIVGASKAALDILQLFPAGDPSVLWAHRGHTAFFPRAEDQQEQIQYLAETMSSCSLKASEENQGRHWSEIALELGLLHKCRGPLTKQKIKCAQGICSKVEIAHANSFKQYDLGSMKPHEGNGGITLFNINGTEQLLGRDATVIFCTGQQNTDFAHPIVDKGYIRSACYSTCATTATLTPLSLAVQQLNGKNDTTLLAKTQLNVGLREYESMAASSQSAQSGREVDASMGYLVVNLNLIVLRDWPVLDPTLHPNWCGPWYAKEISIEEFFEVFGVETSLPHQEIQSTYQQEKASSKVSADLIRLLAAIVDANEDEIDPLMEITDLGITSLRWAELAKTIIRTFGIKLSPVMIYKCITVKDLAAVIEEKIRCSASNKTPILETHHPLTSFFVDDTMALKGWFLQEEGKLPTDQKFQPTIVFCFLGLGGNSEISIRKISSEFNGKDIVPFVAVYPWEKNSGRPLDNKAMDAKCFFKGICQAIATTIQHGYNFALFGHSAGASMACIVEEQLRTVFDLSPLVTIVANAIPPQLLTRTLNRPWLSRIITGMWEDDNQIAAYVKHQIKLSFDFWVDAFHCSKQAWRHNPPPGRFLVIGGDADRLVPRFFLQKWMKQLENSRIVVIKGGGHLCSVDPSKEGYSKTWGIIHEEILMTKAVAPSVGSEFGPLRSSLLSMSEIDLFYYRIGLVSDGYRMNGSFTFDDNVSVSMLRERAKLVVLADPRFIRFRSRISAEQNCFAPVANWSPNLHIDLLGTNSHARSKELWSISVEYQPNRTILHGTFDHVIGDGYCYREFCSALLGASQDTAPPKITLPPVGSKIILKRFQKEIKLLQAKYPLDTRKNHLFSIGSIRTVELCNLSVASIKAYAKSRGGGSVNDVLLMMISEIKRKMNEPHHWVFSTVANRSAANLSDLRNTAAIAPMFVGSDGQLETIRDYTKKFKFLLAHDLATGSSSLSSLLNKPLDNSPVTLLTNMVALQNGNVGGHKLLEQRHHSTKPGVISVGSMGDVLTCTYTVEECDMATIGREVQEHWASIAIDLGLGLELGQAVQQDQKLKKYCNQSRSLSTDCDALLENRYSAGSSDDRSLREYLTLEDFHSFHNMTSSMENSEPVLKAFSKALVISDSCTQEYLKKYFSDTQTPKQYYDFTISSRTRQATLDGQTSRLVAENVDIANPVTYTSKSDEQLCVEPYVFAFLMKEMRASSLKIIRHYEYQFGGEANILMMALHIEVDKGKLVLLEIVKDLEQQK